MSKLGEKFLQVYSFLTLRDVDLTGLTTNSVVLFNVATGKWEANNVEKKYYDSDALSQTTSSTFVDKISETTPSLVGGEYRFHYSAEFSNGNIAKQTDVQFCINGVSHGLVETTAAGTGLGNFSGFSGIKKITLASGTHLVQIQFKSQMGSPNTSNIRNARIYFERVIGEI